MGRSRSWKSTWLAASVLGVSALAASGCGETPPVDSPTAVAPRFASASGAKISVTVTSNGVPLAGALVVPFNSTSGPFGVDGSFVSGVTDGTGSVTLSGLPSGNYCVTVRGLPGNAFTNLLVPVPGMDTLPKLGTTQDYVGGISSSNKTAVPFTLSNWVAYCQNGPPIKLNGSATVTLPLVSTPSDKVSYQVKNLDGTFASVPAWAAVKLPQPLPPWIAGKGLPPDAVPSLLVSTVPDGANAFGLTTADEAIIQTALYTDSNNNRLTATLHAKGGTSGLVATAQSLVCVVNKSAEPAGDNSGPLDFVGFANADGNNYVKVGFGATTALQLDPTYFALWYQQTAGSTGATLNLRFNGTDGGVTNLQADYVCPASGPCSVTTKGGGVGIAASAFAEPGDAGLTRVNWVVNEFPGVSSIDMQLQTNGDKWPNSSRADQVAAFYRLSLPTAACDGGLGSDDRIWIN